MNKKQANSDMLNHELISELQNCQELLHMLSNTVLGGVARMSLDDDLRILSASEGYYRMTGYSLEESHLPPFSDRGINLVVPEDMPHVADALQTLIQKNGPTSIEYRYLQKGGAIAWAIAFCSGVERDEHGRYIDVLFVDTTKEKNAELELEELMNHIPGGLVRAKIDDSIQVLYANDTFYTQVAYEKDEFHSGELQSNFLSVVLEKDRELLLQKAKFFVKSPVNGTSFDFRILTGTGKIRWLRAYCALYHRPPMNDRLIQCVLLDVTKEKEQILQNMLNEERFRIISEQTRDVIFDWDITNDSIHYSPVFEKMFGFPSPTSISTKELLVSDLFYKEDKPIIEDLIAQMRAAVPYVECDARMRGADGVYFWTRHRATTIYDEKQNSIHIVGIVSDIDGFKKETSDWQNKAAHDALTGLWNRVSAQNQIEQILRISKEEVHAFLQFDVDHFKQVNDFMGHAAGDLALQQIAETMRSVFRSSDVLCRMGGDEFSAFLINVSSQGSAIRKVKQFLHAVQCDFTYEEKIYPLSVSVGVAFYPQHAAAFSDLYEKADAALYQAKQAGGNRFMISQSEENEE